MGKALEVIELGDERLREQAKKVNDVFAPEVQELIDNMLATVKKAQGVGLAAPQVGVMLQVFIVSPNPTQRYPHAAIDDTLVVINPKITPKSSEKELDWEGCLSIPGIRGKVNRYKHISVSYQNRLGEFHTEEFSNFTARIFQHEYDHLNGTVFLDKLSSLKTLITDNYYFNLMEQKD
jgi:peptide deformylase